MAPLPEWQRTADAVGWASSGRPLRYEAECSGRVFDMNGMSLRYTANLGTFNSIVAHLYANGRAGKPYIKGMTTMYSRDLLTR